MLHRDSQRQVCDALAQRQYRPHQLSLPPQKFRGGNGLFPLQLHLQYRQDAFPCPAPVPGITCTGGTRYRVGSLAADLSPITTTGRPTPVVTSGSVTGLRLGAAVSELGLLAGDVIVAMAGRLVTSRMMLTDWIAHARVETTVTIRRGATEAVLQFAER